MTLAEAFNRFAIILAEKALKQEGYYENFEKAEVIREALEQVADAAQQVSTELSAGDEGV